MAKKGNLSGLVKRKNVKDDKKDKSGASLVGDGPKESIKSAEKGADAGSSLSRKRKEGGSFKQTKNKQEQTEATKLVNSWVNSVLDKGVPALMEEFRGLAKWVPEGMEKTAFDANKEKNRYLDVPCQDKGRVVLRFPGLDTDYIHANFVATPRSEKRFICAQGPLENTQHHFWAMIIQEDVECVVMLCNTLECGKIKCHQYFPNEKGEQLSFGDGEGKVNITNLEVRKLSEEDPFIRVCKLKVEWKKGDKMESREILHYQWENWPDRGVPPAKFTAVNLLSAVRGCQKPILVHCSAGIGRTGSIVAIAFVLEKMQSSQPCVEMKEFLKELRTQRPWSIQNENQYIYLHRVLLAYFLERYADRFLNDSNRDKYKAWCDEYKTATGCD